MVFVVLFTWGLFHAFVFKQNRELFLYFMMKKLVWYVLNTHYIEFCYLFFIILLKILPVRMSDTEKNIKLVL